MARNSTVDTDRDGGFTMVEVLVGMMILLVGVLGTVTMLNTANASTDQSQRRGQATNIARQIIENARALDYDQQMKPTLESDDSTVDDTVVQALQGAAAGGLSDDSGAGGWQIIRRGVTYTVDLGVCIVDDPKDKAAAS